MFNPTMHTLPIGTLVELFDSPYTATLKVTSTYPYEGSYYDVEDITILEEPDLIRVVTEEGRTSSFRVLYIACQSHQVRLVCEYGCTVLNLTLHKDHPLYERLHESLHAHHEL